MKKLAILSIINLSFFTISYACSCADDLDFFDNKIIKEYSQNCIAVLDSLSYSYEYMGLTSQTGHFTLVDTINHLNASIGHPITVVGQDGLNCGELVHNLTVGDTFLLALSDGFYESFEKDTFYLDGCGTFYVNLSEDQYLGWTTSSLKEKIRLITSIVSMPFLEQSVLLFPNPVSQQLTIQTEEITIENIEIYDGNGQLLLNMDGLRSKMETIIISEYTSGIHFILITTSHGVIHKKFLKI